MGIQGFSPVSSRKMLQRGSLRLLTPPISGRCNPPVTAHLWQLCGISLKHGTLFGLQSYNEPWPTRNLESHFFPSHHHHHYHHHRRNRRLPPPITSWKIVLQQQQQHPKNRWNLWRFRASESTAVLLGTAKKADSFLSTSGCIWRTYNLSKKHQIKSTHQKHPSKSNQINPSKKQLILQPETIFQNGQETIFLVEEKTEKHLVKVISGFLGCMQWGKDGKGYTCQNIKNLFHPILCV